jgi:hypothetical protein
MINICLGAELPALRFEVKYLSCVAASVATVDFFPALLDADYARSVGHPTIFMNTMTLFALIDRFVTDWSGADGFIHSHEVTMHRPTYAGITAEVTGSVTHVGEGPSQDIQWCRLVEVAVSVSDAKGVTASGVVTVALPQTE